MVEVRGGEKGLIKERCMVKLDITGGSRVMENL